MTEQTATPDVFLTVRITPDSTRTRTLAKAREIAAIVRPRLYPEEYKPSSKRFAVRKLDFGKGYQIQDTTTGAFLNRTWNTHRAPVARQAARMNAKAHSWRERTTQ